jgi:hypothetical protein
MLCALLTHLVAQMRHRFHALRDTRDSGYTTETVVVTAVLVTLALIVVTILAAKVYGKANSINLG